ncbi:MAG TPA: cation transporter, partial [Oscillospiraceae bacterium]|nr:cation transporter [Oscillospiraceae bacterium]
MEKTVIKVEGMSCGHCVKAVEGALNELDGVLSAKVDLEAANVTVE